jgi:Prokaryotic phospholipase A2
VVVLVALLFAALAVWVPGAIRFPEHPPAFFERFGAALGMPSASLDAQSTTSPLTWNLADNGNDDEPIGNFFRATPGVFTAGADAVMRAYRDARHTLAGDGPPPPPDTRPARAAARLLRAGLGTAAADVAIYSLAQRIARLRELMSIDITTFAWIKSVGRFLGGGGIDATFNWNDDACSHVLDLTFTTDCGRHDFAYRNTKELGVFERLKAAADDQLRRDVNARCAGTPHPVALACEGWADVLWTGVDLFGDRSPRGVATGARRLVTSPLCSGASVLTFGKFGC